MSSPDTPFPAPWWVHFSDLKEIAISPKRYAASCLRIGRKTTAAFRLGSAFHYHTLGGPKRPPLFLGTKRGADWERFKLANGIEDAAEVLSEDEDETARAMAESVKRHPIASALVYANGAIHEAAREWIGVNGRPCAGRIDVISPRGCSIPSLKIDIPERYAVEVKSAAAFGARGDLFRRDAMKYAYHCQGAWYADAVDAARFFFVVVEKLEPFDVAVWEATPNLLDFGRKQNHLWMGKLLGCERVGKWPGIAESVILDLDMPEESGDGLEWDEANDEGA